MAPQSINIETVIVATDGINVVVTYNVPSDLDQDGNPSVYIVNIPSADAPNQTDLTSQDNYSYYQTLILG